MVPPRLASALPDPSAAHQLALQPIPYLAVLQLVSGCCCLKKIKLGGVGRVRRALVPVIPTSCKANVESADCARRLYSKLVDNNTKCCPCVRGHFAELSRSLSPRSTICGHTWSNRKGPPLMEHLSTIEGYVVQGEGLLGGVGFQKMLRPPLFYSTLATRCR